MNGLWRGLSFLVEVSFDLWSWVLLMRFVLQKVGASYYNPISQLLLQLTEWLIKPTRKYLRLRHVFGFDLALLFWLLIFAVLGVWVMAEFSALMQHESLVRNWHDFGLVILLQALSQLCCQVLSLYFFAILIQAMMTWFAPAMMSPIHPLLIKITDPLLNCLRRFIPRVRGIDIAPMVAIVLLQLIRTVVFGD